MITSFSIGLSLLTLLISACGSKSNKVEPGLENPPQSEKREPDHSAPEETGFVYSESKLLKVRILPDASLAAGQYISLRFQLVTASSSTELEASAIDLDPWMTIHGHGTKKPKVRKALAETDNFSEFGGTLNGRDWVIDDLYFIMSGPWDLKFTIQLPNKPDETVVIPVEVR